MNRPIGIDLFAGAGGLSLGFEQAGFDVVTGVEIDPIHAATHKFNFPNCSIIPHPISTLNGADIREISKIGRKKVDVVFGGPPCQGFSLIGQRALDDPRNSLVKEFVRIVGELDTSYFVFENVKGLTVGKHRKFLEEVINAFEEIGYIVQLPWQVLNASFFGVPQARERLILLGAKKGLAPPVYPEPISCPAGLQISDLPQGPTCHDALGDLPDAEDFLDLLGGDIVLTEDWGEPSLYASILRCTENDFWHFGYPRIWNPKLLTSSLRTRHTEISRRRFEETIPGQIEPISRFFKLSKNGISNTLRAGTDSSRGAFTSPRPIHYNKSRCITVREMARLHGFPDWFRFHETKWHGARQIGNSVPPPLAFLVATQIIEVMGIHVSIVKKKIDLGDSAILKMDMSQASKFWGVTNPIARRDRKSGSKKRKQIEIEIDRFQSGKIAYG